MNRRTIPFRQALVFRVLLYWSLSIGPVHAQPFSLYRADQNIPGFSFGGAVGADVNDDGWLDLAVLGDSNNIDRPGSHAAVWEMVRRGTIDYGESRTTQVDFSLSNGFGGETGLQFGMVSWTDVDNDGDPDLLAAGSANHRLPCRPVARLYILQQNGSFASKDTNIPGACSGSMDWADYDRDGDSDLLMTGTSADGTNQTTVFANQGHRMFKPLDLPLIGVALGDGKWGDWDNDGDEDLIVCGKETGGAFTTGLYRNENGSFSRVETELPGLAYCSMDWGDFDADGDLDLAQTGALMSPMILTGYTLIYRNENGHFQPLDVDLIPSMYGMVTWGDVDNDGLLDLMVTGGSRVIDQVSGSAIYRNAGDGRFLLMTRFPGGMPGTVMFGDLERDADLDVFAGGYTVDHRSIDNLYLNQSHIVNNRPEPPVNPQAGIDGSVVTLSWSPGTDVETPVEGLSYNVRVGTSPGAVDVVSPMASVVTGRRWIDRIGNAGPRSFSNLEGLSPGTYYWSVQTLDNSFMASAFASEQSFIVTASGKDEVTTGTEGKTGNRKRDLLPAFPNPFDRETSIILSHPLAEHVTLIVYNVLGMEVYRTEKRCEDLESCSFRWDGRNGSGRPVAPGVYFYHVETRDGWFNSGSVLFIH